LVEIVGVENWFDFSHALADVLEGPASILGQDDLQEDLFDFETAGNDSFFVGE
jgi:hypothetical protein